MSLIGNVDTPASYVADYMQATVGMLGIPAGGFTADIEAFGATNGYDVEALYGAMLNSSIGRSIYAPGSSNATFAAKLVEKLGGSLLSDDAEAWALDWVEAQLDAGMSRAALAMAVVEAVSAVDTTDANFGAVSQQFANRIEIANYYTFSSTNPSSTATTLLAVLSPVTNATDVSNPAAVLDANTNTGVSTGQTFTLTSSIDSVTGTTGNDTILGDNNTASAADQVTGGAGTDTLKLFGNAAAPAYSGIETVYLSGNTAGFDVSAKTDVTALQLSDPSTGQTYTVTTGQSVAIDTVVAGETVTVAGNTPTSLALTLNGFAATGADATLALTGTKLASLDITTATAASQVTLTNAGAVLSSITIAGDKNLELGSALTTITTINAGSATGNVDIDAVAASTLKFTGGTGNDRINLAATLASNDVIVGGTGTDTLAISDADTLTTAAAVGVTGFEVLEATTADGTAYNVDTIITNNPLTGILISETGGAGLTVSNINSGAVNNIKFTGDTPTATVLVAKDHLSGGTSDAATIILDESVSDHADGVDIATTLTFTLVDKLTVQATSDDSTAARAIVNSITDLTATDLDTIVVTGNAALSITTAATTIALTEVDASASTGAVTLVATASAIPAMIYRGNAQVDTVTVNHASSNAVTVFTGGGSDAYVLGVTGATHTFKFTATDFTTGDVKAGNAITVNTGAAFQAGDTVTLDFGATLEALLKNAGTTLSAASGNVTLVGTSMGATTNVIAVDGGNNTTLQFDLNGDGAFTASADFSVEILGLANNTLNYIAATDVFTFTAAA